MIDCNITKNYFSEKARMSKTTKSGTCKVVCEKCPLSSDNNGVGECCTDFEMLYPEEVIEVVQRWSDEHPQRTYLSEFLKHYPNVELYENGTPKGICPYHLGLMNRDDCDKGCVECWNQPIEESEK
ncbi:hypothetical protein DWW40_09890 [Ruminococcus bromii]|jgi:hypothetical protein|nr:hypothetical protein [Ruminococcus bromii]RGU82414.1 hypothetical protein DWW40_09890 [Ruminococcus bromii]